MHTGTPSANGLIIIIIIIIIIIGELILGITKKFVATKKFSSVLYIVHVDGNSCQINQHKEMERSIHF